MINTINKPLNFQFYYEALLIVNSSNKVPVPPVTSFQAFSRTRSEHFFHSVTSGTAHKNNILTSLRLPCLRADLAPFLSAINLVFTLW
jgi:hypothetical protein